MIWKGKFLGSVLGFFMGGPVGAVLGATIGHQLVDKETTDDAAGIEDFLRVRSKQQIQTAFFNATFTVMGQVAKADGVVSKQEIIFVTRVMDEMRLNTEQRKQAIHLFDEGKKEHFPLRDTLISFGRECNSRKSLLFMFLELQFQTAYADGELDFKKEQLLAEIAKLLGLSHFEYKKIQLQFQVRQHFEQQQQQWRQTYEHYQSLSSLDNAYKTLGLKPSATNDEIKLSYRQLIRKHHPDKLAAQGLSEQVMSQEKETAQKIIKAYETIKSARKL
jgi:DnaJ like chaperone protein